MTAIALVVVVVAISVWSVTEDLRRFLLQASLLVVVLGGAWYAVTRAGRRRVLGVVIGGAAVIAIVFVGLLDDTRVLLLVLARLVLLVVAVALAKTALTPEAEDESPSMNGVPAVAGTHRVLIMNLKSGGGKAERFHLVDECHARGIRAVVLERGDDLQQLAEDAIAGGADVIGMAGGDGSQALVAAVAAARDVPMVVVPAGTRNHLARDLGLDRDDVVGALDAFDHAVERRMDLAYLGDHVFVNNVSLGLYAVIVQSPEYRDAKMDITLATLPKFLGPGTAAFDLQFTGADGERHERAHLIQVSNNPYGASTGGIGSRPRLDTGRLGIIALEIAGDRAAASFLAAVAAGRPERFPGFSAWTADVFEVGSAEPIAVGLDGESLTMEPPLRFTIRPLALRVRLPEHAPGLSSARRPVSASDALKELWQIARGRTPVDST